MLEDFNFHDDLTQEAYEPSQKTSYASHKENQSPLHHRDKEKSLLQLLEQEKEEWEKELINHRETVTEEKVAEVVAMMSGVPIQRIAQAEGIRLS